MKLAQVQGHVTTVSAVDWLIIRTTIKDSLLTVSWGHPAGLEQCVREPTAALDLQQHITLHF